MLKFPQAKYGGWAFENPNPQLVKIAIDHRPQNSTGKPSPSSIQRSFAAILAEGKSQSTFDLHRDLPDLARQENFPSSSSKDEKPTLFGDKQLRTNNYFGGPLFEKVDLKWRETFYTRARGDIIGADDAKIPQPHNLKQIIRSVAVLQSRKMSQSALWVGPRFLISALHLFNWPGNVPTTQQCELLRLDGTTFHVESEITSSILSSNSPKVQLIAFSAENDLGVFKLQDQYPPSSDWIDLDLLMDRDEAAQMNIRSGSKVACIGYSGQIDTLDAKQITWEMAIQLRHKVPAASFEPLNFDTLTKSQMKSFAPGTLDNARINDGLLLYGVSASLWKGSSGGPCVLLDGSENGRIIGLVRGYDKISDPFNQVTAFPSAIKRAILEWMSLEQEG